MAITCSSTAFNFATSGTSCDFGSGPSAGDIDVLFVNSDTTVSTPSGFSIPSGGSDVNNQGVYVFARTAAGGEASSVTITTSGNASTAVDWARVVGSSGIDVVAKATAYTAGTASPSVTSGTLAESGETALVFAALYGFSTLPATPIWNNSFTNQQTNNASWTGSTRPFSFIGIKDNVGTASESASVSWTNSASDRVAFMVTFKAATTGQTVTLSSVSSAEGFGTAQLNLGLSLTGISGAEAFGTGQLNLAFTLTGIESAESFGSVHVGDGSGNEGSLLGLDVQYQLNRIAGTNGLAEAGAANVIAGTNGLELVGALNVAAGTSGKDFQGACNALAGTNGLGPAEALRRVLA